MNAKVKRAWSATTATLLSWLVIATSVGAIQQARYEDGSDVAARQKHFWLVVAGEEEASAPTVENTLAVDLRERLGPRDSDADTLPAEILNFQGSSVSYGGISEELGEDPFAGAGCEECGPLTNEMKKNLLLVKRGEVDEIVEDVGPGEPDIGWEIPAGLLLIALLSFPALSAWPLIAKYRQGRALYSMYPEECRMIAELDQAIEKSRDSRVTAELLHYRHGLHQELLKRAGGFEGDISDARSKRLLEEAKVTLEVWAEGNREATGDA